MKTGNTKKRKKTNRTAVILIVAMVVSLAISLVFFILKWGNTERKTFVFESMDNGLLYVENRYFPKNELIDEVELYVSELLLGPNGNRLKNIFARGTHLNSCFFDPERKNLYVDISKEAVFTDENTSDMNYAVKIFEKNIKKNFIYIDNVYLFIDGQTLR